MLARRELLTAHAFIIQCVVLTRYDSCSGLVSSLNDGADNRTLKQQLASPPPRSGRAACCFTYVYEVRPVLAGHAETEIPPEARVFLNHLQERKKRKSVKAGGKAKTAAAGGNPAAALGADEHSPGAEDGFDWGGGGLPAAAPQVGRVRRFRRSERGCTG